MDFDERLNRANGRLKAGRVRCRLQQIGQKLYVRGTFPPAPGSTKDCPYQQRIALDLPANARGLSLAEVRAREIGLSLESGSFDWAEHRGTVATTVSDWVSKFESESERAELTWRTDYQQPFNKLPPDAPLTAELLRQTLESVKQKRPNSRAQLRAYNAFRQLAEYAEISWDCLRGLKGNYSASEVDPRSLPSDQAIADMRLQIKAPGWRWLFGLLAAYSLRGHEAYKANLADFPILRW